MFCRKCGKELPDDSSFCSKCGASQSESAAPQPAAPAMAAPGGAPAPEEKLWKGRYSGKSMAGGWFLWILFAVGVGYVYWGVLKPETRANAVVGYVCLGCVGLPLLYILWVTMVRKLTVRYRLTTHRLFVEKGFISRSVNELELIRVDDVSVSQNLLQRIFNVGRVIVISTDASDPRLEITGITNPIEVKELIRNHVRQRRDRALHMESL